MGVQFKSVLVSIPLAAAALSFGASATLAQYAGPAITSTSPAASAPDFAMNAEYGDFKILPGDIISIATVGIPELTTTMMSSAGSFSGTSSATVPGLKVGPKGQVELPYLGSVMFAGLTPSEAAVYLSRALKERGILVDPQVSVALMDSPTRVITMIGEVAKPAPVPAFGQLRLLDAISACGGFTQLASHTVTVRRRGSSAPITVELGVDPKMASESNIPLMAGDTVIVPRVGNVFVVGEVKTEEAFPLSSNAPITVMRAISMAGGLKYSAALSKARIIRTTVDNQRVEIKFDLKKLMNGKEQDIALVSDDVLFIPANAFKNTLSSGGAAVASSLLYGSVYAAATIK
jgi:polysaccharide export outer membrane protein